MPTHRNGAKIDQYQPRKKWKALWYQDVHTIKHGRKSVKYTDISIARSILHSPWVSDLSSFALLLKTPPFYCWPYLRKRGLDEKNISCQDLCQYSGFLRSTENFTLDNYSQIYGIMIALMCYRYAFSHVSRSRQK